MSCAIPDFGPVVIHPVASTSSSPTRRSALPRTRIDVSNEVALPRHRSEGDTNARSDMRRAREHVTRLLPLEVKEGRVALADKMLALTIGSRSRREWRRDIHAAEEELVENGIGLHEPLKHIAERFVVAQALLRGLLPPTILNFAQGRVVPKETGRLLLRAASMQG